MGTKFVNQSLPSRPSSRKYIIIIIALVVLVAGVIAGLLIYMNSKTTEYQEDLKEASQSMAEGVRLSEKLEGLTLQVWYDSIHKKKNPETILYIKGTEDFNEALTKLFKADSTQELMNSINDSQEKMAAEMHKLKDPPEGMKKCYEALETVYADYKAYLSLSMDPHGTYKNYKEELTDAREQFDISCGNFEFLLTTSIE